MMYLQNGYVRKLGQLPLILAILACAEHDPTTAPAIKPVPPNATRTASALATFTSDLNAEGGSTLALPSYLAYPEGIKATITVSGRILVWSDTRADYYQKTVNAGPGGVWVDGGYQQCSVGVHITYGSAGFGPPLCNMPTSPPGLLPYDTSGVWSFTAVVYGNGSAIRTPNIPKYAPPSICDTITCHTYTGSQSITVAPLAGDLDLQAWYALESRSARKALFVHPFTNTDTYAHQTVTFTDSTTPRGLPLQSLTHTWTMMDPTAPNGVWNHTQVPATCTRTNPGPVCPVDIREAGIWASNVRVNGVEHADDITVYCAESESLLNNDMVRQQLLAVLDSSNSGSSDYTQRSERYFLILQDSVTPGSQPYLQIYPHLTTDDVCFVHTVIPLPASLPPNTKIVAQGHDHPSEPNVSVMCKDSTGARTIAGKTVNGADQGDRDWADRVNTLYPSMPGYIIDKHNVYVQRPGQSLGQEHDAGNQFNWDGRGKDPTRLARRCGWPKRIVP